MPISLDAILRRAISQSEVKIVGHLTRPRTYGVYRLPCSSGATRKFRFGNHPIRQQELESEFGRCNLEHLFLSRGDAETVAKVRNAGEA